MRSTTAPRALGLSLAITLACALTACVKSEEATPADAAATAGAAADAAPAAEPAPPRADVPADAQVADEQVSLADIQGMKESAACSMESALYLADATQSPGPMPNTYLVGRGKHYQLSGFVTNKETGSVPANFRLVLVGAKSYAIAAHTGSERPDVAEYFKQPAFAKAGYQADVAFDDVEPGEYQVFVIEGEGNDRLACPTHQLLTVR